MFVTFLLLVLSICEKSENRKKNAFTEVRKILLLSSNSNVMVSTEVNQNIFPRKMFVGFIIASFLDLAAWKNFSVKFILFSFNPSAKRFIVPFFLSCYFNSTPDFVSFCFTLRLDYNFRYFDSAVDLFVKKLFNYLALDSFKRLSVTHRYIFAISQFSQLSFL